MSKLQRFVSKNMRCPGVFWAPWPGKSYSIILLFGSSHHPRHLVVGNALKMSNPSSLEVVSPMLQLDLPPLKMCSSDMVPRNYPSWLQEDSIISCWAKRLRSSYQVFKFQHSNNQYPPNQENTYPWLGMSPVSATSDGFLFEIPTFYQPPGDFTACAWLAMFKLLASQHFKIPKLVGPMTLSMRIGELGIWRSQLVHCTEKPLSDRYRYQLK